jgi:disulfide bond formation protein DsbB
VPCRLCWMQRIAMYPLAVILLVAAARRDRRGGVLYAAAFPVAGTLVSAYHLYIEANPDKESPACRVSAPCSTKWIEEFGYVTIPMLAITAFLTIGALLAMAWSRRDAAG